MAEFYTRVNGVEGTYQITFTTYDEKQYKEVENLCREFIDHKHPEPVYPTWRDYLHSIGVLYNKHTAGGDVTEIHWGNMMTPIPADIAEKLGIEPKEKHEQEKAVCKAVY